MQIYSDDEVFLTLNAEGNGNVVQLKWSPDVLRGKKILAAWYVPIDGIDDMPKFRSIFFNKGIDYVHIHCEGTRERAHLRVSIYVYYE